MKYWAFLSYSHTDKKWGDWLHKSLETYRVPRRLVGKESRDGKIPERLFPIFRDREELPVSADLGSNINEALKESRYLIVICSPRSAQSHWVGEEIKTFKKLGREDRILALIVDGEPNASDGKPGFKVEDECFHEAMRYRWSADGEVSEVRSEPIAADAREIGDGKTNAKLKLLAGLLGVNYDDLKQREQERRLRRARRVVAASIAMIGIFAALSVALFFKEREATRARNEARATLSRSDFLQAVRAIDDGKTSEALAFLARSISFDPDNRAALCRLTTLLTYHDYGIPHRPFEHHDSVRSAEFSPDGARVVTGCSDGNAQVWDVATNKPLTEPMKHSDYVSSVEFSSDGKRVLTISGDYTARVWDAVSGKALSDPMKHDGKIVAAQFSRDSTRVLTTSADAKVSDPPRVWDAQTGKLLSGPMKAEENEYVKFAQLSPDGARLLTVSRNNSAKVREADTGEPLSAPMKHENTINTAEFSSDGKRIVTASEDKTVRVWDAETGKPLIEPITHDDSVVSAQFSSDGKRIMTLASRLIRIWDAETGKQLLEPTSDNSQPFLNRGSLPSTSSVRFSPDGKRIVTACYDGTAQVWDVQTGRPLTEPMKHDDAVRSAEFSPDGKRIVTVSSNVARVWDTQTGKPVTEPIKLPTKGEEIENDDGDDDKEPVVSAQFSPDSKRIVTTSGKIARVWDSESGKPVGQPMQHRGEVNFARCSSDGKRIVTIGARTRGTLSNPIQVWDADTGKPLTDAIEHGKVRGASARFTPDGKRLVVTPREGIAVEIWDVETGQELNPQESASSQEHSLTVKFARFSPDETRIVVTSGVTARVCDVQTGKTLTERMKHDGEIKSAEFSPDGKRVVTASTDKTARVWDAETGKPLTQPIRHDESVESAEFGSDGKWIVTVSGKQARVWDAQSGKPITDPMQHESSVSSAEFSRDGRRILTVSDSDRVARVWDARTSKLLIEPMDAGSAHFSPDGGQILGASNRTVRIWDAVPTGRAVCERLSHDNHILSAQFSPDGKRIAITSEDGTARVWDAFTGRAITNLTLEKDQWVHSAQFSSDGKRIVTRSDRTARIWDAGTGKPLTEPMKHDGYIQSVQFSPDGKSVLTASRDKTAQLWDATTGKRLIPPIKHDGAVNVARFSSDGSRIITGSSDRTARVWDAKTAKPLTGPIQHEAKGYSKGDVKVAEFSPDGKRILTAAELGPAQIWDAKTTKPLTEPFHLGLGLCAQFDASGDHLVTAGNLAAVVLDSRTGKPLIGGARLLDGSLDGSAEFSPDGNLFITSSRNLRGSADARLWDSATGKPLAEPFKPETVTAISTRPTSLEEEEWSLRSGVTSAHFNSQGNRIVAALADNTARVWDIMPAGKGSPEWLPRLADAMAGEHLNNRGFFEELDKDPAEILKELKDKLDKEAGDDEWVVWGKWFLGNYSTRTISPFSKMTVPEYIEDRIKENTAESLDEAERLAVGNAQLLERIKKAREELGYRRR